MGGDKEKFFDTPPPPSAVVRTPSPKQAPPRLARHRRTTDKIEQKPKSAGSNGREEKMSSKAHVSAFWTAGHTLGVLRGQGVPCWLYRYSGNAKN